MKRHIAIPLLCVVLVAALSFPVFATSVNPSFPYPENNLSGFGFVTVTSHTDPVCTLFDDLAFGNMFCGYFVDPSNEFANFDTSLSFTLSVYVESYLYIAVNSNYLVLSHDFGSLGECRDELLDYNVDFGDNWPVTVYTADTGSQSFVASSGTHATDVTFLGFSDVLPGEYSITIDYHSSVDFGPVVFGVYASGNSSGGGESGGTDTDDSGSSGGSGSYPTGNSATVGYNKIVDKYINGTYTYTEALDQLGDRYDLISTDNIYQNLLYVNEYQMSVSKLNGLVSSSAAQKSADLDGQMSATVDQFADGSIDLKGAMDTLQGDFSTALSGAQTVDEADALTTVYQVKLLQLENESRIKLMEGFDTVITDEQIQNANDYYAAEGELLNAFDLADLEAQFQYELWWNQMPKNETIEYKKFFDYLLNESDIRFFITIPLAMSLVAIIMGTRMRTKPDSDSDPDVSHVWFSDGSAYHHKD